MPDVELQLAPEHCMRLPQGGCIPTEYPAYLYSLNLQ